MKNKKAIIIVIVIAVIVVAAYFLLKKKPAQPQTTSVPDSTANKNVPITDLFGLFGNKSNANGIKYPDKADLAGFNQDDILNYSGHTFSANVAGGNWTLIS